MSSRLNRFDGKMIGVTVTFELGSGYYLSTFISLSNILGHLINQTVRCKCFFNYVTPDMLLILLNNPRQIWLLCPHIIVLTIKHCYSFRSFMAMLVAIVSARTTDINNDYDYAPPY